MVMVVFLAMELIHNGDCVGCKFNAIHEASADARAV